jgi:formylglycine-generating enzyme required for sulfatase activity/tRNA A-37 threonylcarbamoyl transferase component Bud32
MTGMDAGREFGAYRLLYELGRGGMGTVHVAMQRTLQRVVALKVLSPNVVGERAMWRFQREAKLLAKLEHPGIVKVIDSGAVDGLPFFAMELVAGASLADILRELAVGGVRQLRGDAIRDVVQRRARDVDGGPIEPASWSLPSAATAAMVTVVAEVATSLASVHAAGVVHRDVKPSNILLRRDGAVRIADFGIAHRSEAAAMTLTGELAGTPSYMAPEQLRGELVDHRTDVFALGAVLYQALTLQQPFVGGTVAARLGAIDDPPVPAERHVSTLPRDLLAVLGKAMAPVAADRYQSAGDLAADLRAFVAGQPVRVRRPGRLQMLWRQARRRPWSVAAALLAVIGALVVVSIDLRGRRQVQAESERVTTALTELQRLEVGVRLDNAIAAALAHRVARFEDVAAMDAWLAEHGQPLAAELPRFEQQLLRLRDEALPYGDAERAADRAGHPAVEDLARIDFELEFLDQQLAKVPPPASAAARRQVVAEARERLLEQLEATRSWRLPSAERQFLHDQVAKLVDRLRAFAAGPNATVARIAAQRDWALTSHRRAVVEAATSWESVAADLAADPRFAGLRLRPQRDLLPLAKDPRSALWEFVHLRSGESGRELPERDQEGRLRPGVDMGIVFVLLPGGSFPIGAQATDPGGPNHDPGALPEEQPVRTVALPPFFCGKYELTVEQWARIVGVETAEVAASDRQTRNRQGRAPCEPMDTVSQVRSLRVLADHGLALPTEAQWEYACRAGTTSPFPFGARARVAEFANFADAKARRIGLPTPDTDLDDGFARVAPVGSFAANDFGLYDTLGNLGELVDARLNMRLKLAVPKFDLRQQRFDDSMCMVRGGSFRSPVQALRAAARRDLMTVDQAQQDTGLRVVRAIDA